MTFCLEENTKTKRDIRVGVHHIMRDVINVRTTHGKNGLTDWSRTTAFKFFELQTIIVLPVRVIRSLYDFAPKT